MPIDRFVFLYIFTSLFQYISKLEKAISKIFFFISGKVDRTFEKQVSLATSIFRNYILIEKVFYEKLN